MAVNHSDSVRLTSRTKLCRWLTREVMTLANRGSSHVASLASTACVMLFSSNSRMKFTKRCGPLSAIGVVGSVIAGQPALQGLVGVGAPVAGDLLCLRMVAGELQD